MRIYGVQFHPEVAHTERGQEMLKQFLFDVCGCRPSWTNSSIIEQAVEEIRAQVGDERVICGLSGGVDSAVAAALVHKAIGDQLTCVFVDTGLLRLGEAEQVEETFRRQFNVDLVHVKAADRFLAALDDIQDPERKRKIIGETFIRVFEEVARDFEDARFLVQGTLYPDIVESGGERQRHDQVAPQRRRPPRRHGASSWSSRCATCSRTRCARSARSSGCPRRSCGASRSPARASRCASSGRSRPSGSRSCARPTPSSSRRSSGPASTARSGRASRCCRRCAPSGVMGDGRTYEYPIIVRAVTCDDAMTADWARLPDAVLERIASRIINEVPGVNRVAYDITSKPPGTIEWE